jgi:hypothetical protein
MSEEQRGGARVSASAVTDTEEGRELLQRRLGIWGLSQLVLAGASWGVLAILYLVSLAMGRADTHAPFSFGGSLHFANAAVAGALWLGTRGGRRSAAVLLGLDQAVSLALTAIWALAGATLPDVTIGTFIAILCFVIGTLARAIVVPSTARRTLLLGVVGAAAIVGLSVWRGMQAVQLGLPEPAGGVLASSAAAACWNATAVALAVIASHTIFGLRREVQRARVLGQYTLEEKLGEGGMGAVWRARHALLRRPTAVKLLPPERAGNEAIERFEREVQLTARLTHPSAVAIYDYGRTRDGIFYYAMELVPGWDLERLVEEHGALPPERVVHVLIHICGALAEAHDLGLVHRDVKPANVLLAPKQNEHELAKLVDFGLVKTISSGEGPTALTGSNTITGTPLYMAPEAIRAPDAIDGRTDLYALGAVAWFLLVGRPPFEGASIVEVCGHHLHSTPKRPSVAGNASVPEEVEELVLACLEKEPAARPTDARTLRSRLEATRCAEAWTAARAAAWWREHPAPSGREGGAGAMTLDVAPRGGSA